MLFLKDWLEAASSINLFARKKSLLLLLSSRVEWADYSINKSLFVNNKTSYTNTVEMRSKVV